MWVFGYGSLVSPASLATTIGRDPGTDVHVTHLAGYGRRWNYGSITQRGDWQHDGITVTDGVVIALGLAAADGESCNGVIFRVDDDELARLDLRERDYDRVDVSDRIDLTPDGPVFVYVPRPRAIERYERARDERRAAVRRSYWTLVGDAFAALGDDHHATYLRTPPPDVPIADVVLRP